jgi:dATP pyrophosphohydrolase
MRGPVWPEMVAGASLPRVIPVSCTQVEAHVFRRRGKRLEVLLIRRSPERSLAGVWQPVTGGIEAGESPLAAAVREVREETGLTPLRWWALEHLATFYDPAVDTIRVVPVFAAEVAWTDAVQLSHEHDRYAFLGLADASKRVLWATQRHALAALRDEIVSGSAGGAAREVTARVAARVGSRARRAGPASSEVKPSRRGRRAPPATRRGQSSTASNNPRARRARN